ncbi:phage holin family protein [Polyangium sp. y55x31]|uniref:phage holin family protein n=1 Tax=Polyangium sp. y55x31 TaxID=3042688 RepID=UPI0024822446|nr:phage holin family protein [Polyangium sp. y55x31]MDI1482662.1 phage holin family protein [Polyangium sp. y55x31]
MPAASSDPAPPPAGVTCRFCQERLSTWTESHCPRCGGALPAPDRPRESPPDAPPRRLPLGYRRHALLQHQAVRRGLLYAGFGLFLWIPGFLVLFLLAPWLDGIWIVGVGFLLVGVISGAIGYADCSHALTLWREHLHLLTHGTAVRGLITASHVDTSTFVRGRHPHRIEYVFMVEGRSTKGSVEAPGIPKDRYRVGMPVWVLYTPGNLARSSIWPPVR